MSFFFIYSFFIKKFWTLSRIHNMYCHWTIISEQHVHIRYFNDVREGSSSNFTRDLPRSLVNPTWHHRGDVIVPTFCLKLRQYDENYAVRRTTEFARAWEQHTETMLRSTGYFRGIDCPFYAEYSEGKGDRNGCNRPYCHFRHSKQRRASYGAPVDVKKQRDIHSANKGANF